VTFCAELCLELPADFPAAEFAAFMAEARRVLIPSGKASAAWNEFAGASNLIGLRYRASFDTWREYRDSLKSHGGGHTHEDVYQQECSLFVMFSAGVSCVESTAYALAAAASDKAVCGLAFTDKERRVCSPTRLLTWLVPYSNATEMTAALRTLVGAQEWTLWVDLRNRMTHRSNLPRRHFASIGSPAPQVNPINYVHTSSTPEVDADIADWDALHQWLAQQLQKLLLSGIALLGRSSP
jgi:hypothetical protein